MSPLAAKHFVQSDGAHRQMTDIWTEKQRQRQAERDWEKEKGTDTFSLTQIQTCTQKHTSTHTCTRICIHAHVRACVRAHTHYHTHTKWLTCLQSFITNLSASMHDTLCPSITTVQSVSLPHILLPSLLQTSVHASSCTTASKMVKMITITIIIIIFG